ncbi:MAG: hypothetical protein J7K40_02740 [candidate division Zixibacteria bacterium]|nr:hypothetical protein [candidate division Zixibacteria bacterium]
MVKVWKVTGSEGTVLEIAADTFVEAIWIFEMETGELAKKVEELYEEVYFEKAVEVV